MDSITQATLGAAIGQAILGRKIGGRAAVIGAVIATIPDLDVVLLPFYDSLERISIHRGFSHSIVFSIIGAFVIAYILSRIKLTKPFSFLRLLSFTWLALFTHMLLDAFTAYGTQLFLPFSDYRVSFDSVNIVDPVYTLPLLIGLLYTIYRQIKKKEWSNANQWGLIISTIYLLFTLGHKNHVTDTFKLEFQEQNISYSTLRAIPVGVGNIAWYGVARSEDTLYIGKLSDAKHNHVAFHSFAINAHLLDGIDRELSERLKWFAQDFYTVAEDNGIIRLYNLQCDMQGVRTYGDYKAPTAFYYEITPKENGEYDLTSGMHMATKK